MCVFKRLKRYKRGDDSSFRSSQSLLSLFSVSGEIAGLLTFRAASVAVTVTVRMCLPEASTLDTRCDHSAGVRSVPIQRVA